MLVGMGLNDVQLLVVLLINDCRQSVWSDTSQLEFKVVVASDATKAAMIQSQLAINVSI